MTIRRIAADRPSRRALGHLDVTIDDLRALMELLQAKTHATSPIVAEFDEGEFDSASDIKDLSDVNLLRIAVKAPEVTVVLAANKAEAVGSRELVDFVFNAWARQRQAKFRPPTWSKFDQIGTKIFPFIAIAGVIYLFSMIIPAARANDAEWSLFIFVGLFGFAGWIAITANKSNREVMSYARIIPISADEMRKYQRDRQTPRWALYVSIAALAASLAFNVITLIKKW
ncbi:hypothetical protein AB0G02_19785 [Actinosynnema sp. NPDC023658]|uniref:hypothetical protein n=1 Tax=Actinosynnema sp. NPDC023658 TaxID=3155465 RepID=UPI0033FAB62B